MVTKLVPRVKRIQDAGYTKDHLAPTK